MKIPRIALAPILSVLVVACNHPIEISGDGDVTSASGNRNCYLEDYKAGKANCTKNTVVGAYQETYYATPRDGWSFDKWEGCQSPASNACSFAVPAETVSKAWGATAPPLVAVFSYTLNELPRVIDRDFEINGRVLSCFASDLSGRLRPEQCFHVAGDVVHFSFRPSRSSFQISSSKYNSPLLYGTYEDSRLGWAFKGDNQVPLSSVDFVSTTIGVIIDANQWQLGLSLGHELNNPILVAIIGKFQ